MAILLETNSIEPSDNKAVCYFTYGNHSYFTTEYIPRYLRANKPEDVRFIVHCKAKYTGYDIHYGRKASHTTEYFTLSFRIVDRHNGNVIDTWSDEFISTIFDVYEIEDYIDNAISKYLA